METWCWVTCLSREEGPDDVQKSLQSQPFSDAATADLEASCKSSVLGLLYLLHHLNPIRVSFLLSILCTNCPFVSFVSGPSSTTKQRPLCHDPASFPRAHLDRSPRRNQDSPFCSWPQGQRKGPHTVQPTTRNVAFSLRCVVILNIIITNKNMAHIPPAGLKILGGRIIGISRVQEARLDGPVHIIPW